MKIRIHNEDYHGVFRYFVDPRRDPDQRVRYNRGVHCHLTLPGGRIFSAAAVCDSRRPFVKFTGRKIALTKAFQQALPHPWDRPMRALLWFHYLRRLGTAGIKMALTGARKYRQHERRASLRMAGVIAAVQ